MKNISFFIFIPAFCIIYIIGCAKVSNRINSDTSTIIESELLPDSTIESEEITEAPIPVLPDSFSSVKELKSYLNQIPDSALYSEGLIGEIAEYSLKYANKLLHNEYSRFIVVDKSRMKVVLFDKYGRMEKTYGMACAKNYGSKHKKADSRTPEGYFSVEGIYDSEDWLFTDDDGVTSPIKGQFGPKFIRLKIPITYQIGIHGTVAPWSIGARTSHGCIRITNENILELVKLVDPGMPVIIVPGRRDMSVNMEEGYDIDWIPTVKGAKPPKVNPVVKKTEKADTIIPQQHDSISQKPMEPELKQEEQDLSTEDSTEPTD